MTFFNQSLAIELLTIAQISEFFPINVSGATLKGKPLRADQTKRFIGRNGNSDTEGYTSVSEDGDIVVAFRSSETQFFKPSGALRDWFLTDLRSNRMLYPPEPGKWPNHTWVHTGFWLAYNVVRDNIQAEVSRLIMESPPPAIRRIYATGFSLGGPLAFLASIDLGLLDIPVELYTFAGPRAGDSSLNQLMRSRTDASHIVVYGCDPVPRLPPVGPDLPLTLHKIAVVEIGPANLGGIVVPQVGQEYETPDRIAYLDGNGHLANALPLGPNIELNFAHHNYTRYDAAIRAILPSELGPPPKPGPKVDVAALTHMLRS